MVNHFSINSLAQEPNQMLLLSELCSESINENRPIVLFGSGTIGKLYLDYFKSNNCKREIYFCDNNPALWGTSIEGIPVINFSELVNQYNNAYTIVCSLDYYDEISMQLNENNLESIIDPGAHYALLDTENITKTFSNYRELVVGNLVAFQQVYDLLNDELSKMVFSERINYCITASSKYLLPLKSSSPQYFDPDIVKLSDKEIFVDGGAYVGDTVEEFLEITRGKFDIIYSFEPEKSKHDQFKMVTRGHERIHLEPYGLWSKKEVLRFNSQGNYASGLDEEGNTEIPVISVDEVLDGQPVTFIKMDIEGAELEALKGAAESIKKYKPKLAICIYHKPLDIVEIPLYLQKLVPEYKLYIRHYGTSMYETVCYAVIE